MIAQSLSFVQHIDGSIGIVADEVLSPYYTEEVAGVTRLKVLTRIPGSNHTGWDWWLPADVVALPAAPIAPGAQAVVITRKGSVAVGTVLAVAYNEVALMFQDGTTGWVDISRTQVIPVLPATIASAIA